MLRDLQGQSSAAKGGGAPGKQKRGGKDSCLEELAASSLEAAWRFPPALRLFVLFLEAADSHRLNKALLRQAHTMSYIPSGNQMHAISCGKPWVNRPVARAPFA